MGLKRTQGQKRNCKKGTRKQQNKRTGKRKTAKKNLRRKRQTKRRLKGGAVLGQKRRFANSHSYYQQGPNQEGPLLLEEMPHTLALKDYKPTERMDEKHRILTDGKVGDKVKIYEDLSEKFHLFNIINKDNGEKDLSYIETSESNGEVKILDEKGLMENLFGSIGPTLSPMKKTKYGVHNKNN